MVLMLSVKLFLCARTSWRLEIDDPVGDTHPSGLCLPPLYWQTRSGGKGCSMPWQFDPWEVSDKC